MGGSLALHAGCKFFPFFKSHFLIKCTPKNPITSVHKTPRYLPKLSKVKHPLFRLLSSTSNHPRQPPVSYLRFKPLFWPGYTLLLSRRSKSFRMALECEIDGVLLLSCVKLIRSNHPIPHFYHFSASFTHFEGLR